MIVTDFTGKRIQEVKSLIDVENFVKNKKNMEYCMSRNKE